MSKDAFLKFSPRILDHLGVSAYDNLQKCLTELVANAYDADSTEVRVYLPDVVIDENASLEGAALYLWSFGEILQSARMRFEKILEILGQ